MSFRVYSSIGREQVFAEDKGKLREGVFCRVSKVERKLILKH